MRLAAAATSTAGRGAGAEPARASTCEPTPTHPARRSAVNTRIVEKEQAERHRKRARPLQGTTELGLRPLNRDLVGSLYSPPVVTSDRRGDDHLRDVLGPSARAGEA